MCKHSSQILGENRFHEEINHFWLLSSIFCKVLCILNFIGGWLDGIET